MRKFLLVLLILFVFAAATLADDVAAAAERKNGPFSYLRGFRYFDADRLHLLKPATMRNWCRTAALNDADAIFEHLVTQST